MRRFTVMASAVVLLFAAIAARAQKPAVKPRQPVPVNPSMVLSSQAILPLATVNTLTATPATISSGNPDGTATGTTAVTWTQGSGSNSNTWKLRLYTTSSPTPFSGCNSPPTTAAQVSCSSASVGAPAGGGTATCSISSPTVIPTSSGAGLQVASGKESTRAGGSTFTVNLTYTFTDSWHYQVGSPCTLGITYALTTP